MDRSQTELPHQHASGLVHSTGKPRRMLAGLRYRMGRICRPSLRTPPKGLMQKLGDHDPQSRQMSFTFAVIALAARVACAEGPLTPRKYAIFRESFPLQDDMSSKIRSLFGLACRADTPLACYISLAKYTFPGHSGLLAAVVDRLFRIATADGHLHIASERVLADVAHGLDIPAHTYSRMLARYLSAGRPHAVLGLEKHAGRDAIKSRYRELMRHYHPDRHASQSLSPEMSLLLQLKSSEINAAYHAMVRQAA